MTPSTSDLALLTSLLTLPVDDDHDFPSDGTISDSEEKAFSSMKAGLESGKWSRLTEKQRAWAKGVLERASGEPEYLNLASSGKLCRGREVETPEVLKNLPKSPPRKREG